MKKLIPTFLILFLSYSLSAQYKKASFLSKQGRTYEAGAQLYALGKGQGNPIGYKLAFGRDQDGKQLFSFWELQYIPSYKYAYTTTSTYDNTPVKVNGSTNATLIYALNYGYHLLKNDNPEQKVKPFVFAGINIVLLGGIKTESSTPEYTYGKKQTNWPDLNTGVGGGLGSLFNFSEKLGLKVQAGYAYMFSLKYEDDGEEKYTLFGSHPYVSAGLRLRIVSE
jgi:hypothetical protein